MTRKIYASTVLLYNDLPGSTIARGIKMELRQDLGEKKSTFLLNLRIIRGAVLKET
jgi:hypothetical protein